MKRLLTSDAHCNLSTRKAALVAALAISLALSVGLSSVAPAWAGEEAAAVERRLADSARYLASDELEGRGLATKGIDLAADYIAEQFEQIGLQTALFDGEPFQKFMVTTKSELGEANELSLVGPAKEDGKPEKTIELKLGTDFSPLSSSGSGTLDLPLVFVGYGITAKEEEYDDYADVDVEGKAVVVLRHEPQQQDPHSKFNGTKHSMHAPLSRKVSNAYEHGAAAVIFCTDQLEIDRNISAGRKRWEEAIDRLVEQHEKFKEIKAPTLQQIDEQRKRIEKLTQQIDTLSKSLAEQYDPVLPFQTIISRGGQRDFPVLHCRRAVLDRIVTAALGEDLATLEMKIDEGPTPHSRELTPWRVVGKIEVRRNEVEAKNVVAVLPGHGPLADEAVVVGAHYDHIGYGGHGSLEPGKRAVHNGADDNASGVAVILEIARALAGRPEKPRRSVVFIAFTGEEMGLLGSSHYAANPLVPIERTVAMLNFDMVGHLREDKLTVMGSGTGGPFDELLDRFSRQRGLKLTKRPAGFGPSDQSAFNAKEIPAMHFFTGTHKYYHRPSDDFEHLNIEGMRRVGELATDVAAALLEAPERPEYVVVKPSRAPSSGGERPYFGSIPDFGGQETGYAISGVAKDGPADRAGLQGGDVVVRFGKSKIGNLEDFDNALRKYKAGNRVPTVVLRDGKEVSFEVVLDPPR